MCIETAFFRYTAGCRMFFLSLVFISLNRKGTLESIRECLYKGCFPILYKLTSSVREKQHFFCKSFVYVLLLYLFQVIFSPRLEQNSFMRKMVSENYLHFFIYKTDSLYRIEFVFDCFFTLIYFCSLLEYAFLQIKNMFSPSKPLSFTLS